MPPPETAAVETIVARDGGPGLTVVRVSTPVQAITLVPYLLGFHPAEWDLVLVGTIPPRGRVHLTLRLDLPARPGDALAAAQARYGVALLSAHGCTMVTVVGYGPDAVIGPALRAAREAARAAGLRLAGLLRADAGRWWSCQCTRPECCPPDGTPYEPDPAVTTPFDKAGARVLPGRDVLAATIAPVAGADAEAMRVAMQGAARRLARLSLRASRPGRRASQPPAVIAGVRAVTAAIRLYRQGGTITSHDQLAWLALALSDIRVRDAAWTRMDPAHKEPHRRLWTTVTRLAPDGMVAAPASLLAFTAWQDGNGALAQLALDRALAASPRYQMALILREALDLGAPPALAALPVLPRKPRHPA